jgi:hypothetical protein
MTRLIIDENVCINQGSNPRRKELLAIIRRKDASCDKITSPGFTERHNATSAWLLSATEQSP